MNLAILIILGLILIGFAIVIGDLIMVVRDFFRFMKKVNRHE